MAQCRYCQKYIPEGVVQCPHCQALLQASATQKGETVSPFEVRARALQDRRQVAAKRSAGGLPASQMAVLGCLGLIGVLAVGALIFGLVAPDKARSLVFGTPTPLPPTPSPTATPTPIPTPTPLWKSYDGPQDSYMVEFPPYWVVVDYTIWNWDKIFWRDSLFYSWLEEKLPEEKRLEEAEAKIIHGLDPRYRGDFSVVCREDLELAGLSAREIRTRVGQDLLEQGQRGVSSYLVQVDGQSAALFEYETRVEFEDAEGDTDYINLKNQHYVLADEDQGYWISVVHLADEFNKDKYMVQAIVESFHLLGQPEQRDD